MRIYPPSNTAHNTTKNSNSLFGLYLLFLALLCCSSCGTGGSGIFGSSGPGPNNNPKSLSIVGPGETNNLVVGQQINIEWFCYQVGEITLSYSLDNGSSWTRIVKRKTSSTYVVGTGCNAMWHCRKIWVKKNDSTTWTVPDAIGTRVHFRIEGGSLVNYRALSRSIVGSLSYTGPGSDAYLHKNDVAEITWNSSGSIGRIGLDYSIDEGNTWTLIADNEINDGSYNWTLPNTESDQLRIRVRSATLSSQSPENITLTKEIKVLSPNGSEAYIQNYSLTLNWVASTTINQVDLDYSLDNGASWNVIASATANDGSFDWTTPHMLTEQALFRVSNSAQVSMHDESDSTWRLVPSTIYVDQSVSSSGDGYSWATAVKTIQEAVGDSGIAVADTQEVWIAAGTYIPDSHGASILKMKKGIHLYGGFQNGDTFDVRDWENNPCILDGQEHSLPIVIGASDAILDGFTIYRNGPSNNGSGLTTINVTNLFLSNCIFRDNKSKYGGAVYNFLSTVTYENCLFINNHGQNSGGAVYSYDSNTTYNGCSFINNACSGYYGGAVYNDKSTHHFTNCLFNGNQVGYSGGSSTYGGALYNYHDSITYLTNCTLTQNTANWSGSAIYSRDECYIHNCIISGNTQPKDYPQAYSYDDSKIHCSHSLIEGSKGSSGWDSDYGRDAGANIDLSAKFIDYDGADNIAGNEDDDLRLDSSSPAIDSGRDSHVPSGVSTDLDKNDRFNGTVDMGAYEYTPSAVL